MSNYILAIDQSTQGTKALIFDGDGAPVARADLPHRQIVNERGWVEHDPDEIYANTLRAVKNVVDKSGIDKRKIAVVGLSNQRETSLVWDRTGKPLYNAIVWQDARAASVCHELDREGFGETVAGKTGIRLSPYFPAAKLAWVLRNVDAAAQAASAGDALMGTVDTWLVYRLTGGTHYQTDYSNASRTQLFNIHTLEWDGELCSAFGIDAAGLAAVTDSDGYYGETDFEGFLEHSVPIRAVMGDSHGALYGQGCTEAGMLKATYGTGSSVMMNVGDLPVRSQAGLVSSLAWKIKGRVNYVLEGNINYAGAVITWLKDDLGLVESAGESETLARAASKEDRSILVPAFSGLGAPYWDSEAVGVIWGMTRTTKKAEIVRAALDSIAFQITDIVRAMEADTGMRIAELRVDGGPTANGYLMQFQSDIARIPVKISPTQELSAMGAAIAAGAALGMYDAEKLFGNIRRREFLPEMDTREASLRCDLWKQALKRALHSSTL